MAGTISITTPATDTAVGLTVTEATSGVPPYTRQWHRSTASGFNPTALTAIEGATGLTLDDSSLTPETTYYYKVVQYDANLEAVVTAQQEVTTEAESEPETPDAVTMAVAHTALTDGAGETEVPLFGDAADVAARTYSGTEMCWYGVNAPQGVSPSRPTGDSSWYDALVAAGIKAVRYELPWYGLEQKSHAEFDATWYGANADITQYATDGCTVIGLLAYTPGWANGCRGTDGSTCRPYPPRACVEEEAASFTNNVATLDNGWLLNTSYVMPSDVTTTEHTSEELTADFSTGAVLQTAHTPVKPSTVRVWVGETEWTRGTTVAAAALDATVFWCDHHGRIWFRDNDRIAGHGAVPAAHSTITATYESYDTVYDSGVDYSVDSEAGEITRATSTSSVTVTAEAFDGPTLNGAWSWTNEPSWSANGVISWTRSTTGTTKLTQAITGAGDFVASIEIDSFGGGSSVDTSLGFEIGNASGDWIVYRLTHIAGDYIRGDRKIGGQDFSASDGGFQSTAPRTLNVRRTGDHWKFWASDPTPGYDSTYEFDAADWDPTYISINHYTGAGVTSAVEIAAFTFSTPAAVPDNVLVSYDWMDTTDWAAYVTKCVNTWKTKVKHWEMWNEPGEYWCWNGGARYIARMCEAGAAAAKAEDATCLVTSPGYAQDDADSLGDLYDTIGTDVTDVEAWHPYPQLTVSTAPTYANWVSASTNAAGRAEMVSAETTAKQVFLGELSTRSTLLVGTDRLNDRTQAEDGIAMCLAARKAGWVKSMQWWPAVDLYPPGDHEAGTVFGDHDGLFYNSTGYGGEPVAMKPAFYAYGNLAGNTGILLDLGSVQTCGMLVLSCSDRSQVAGAVVKGSLTATSADCKPASVGARLVSGTTVFAVTVDTEDADLVTEVWTATANAGDSTFAVAGSVSGAQGTATKEVAFESTNGVCAFTIPAGTYTEGQVFTWETFAGDGFTELGTFTRTDETGAGDITIDMGDESARYLLIELTKEEGAHYIGLTQIEVLDDGDANISDDCLYAVEGWQASYVPA